MKQKTRLLSTLLIIISTAILGCSVIGGNVGAVKTLIQLGKNDKLKQKALNQETSNFQRLKKYIETDKIKAGVLVKYAARKFGEPVVYLSEENGQSWIYKAASADWFGGEKIYLYFNNDGELTGWECVDCE